MNSRILLLLLILSPFLSHAFADGHAFLHYDLTNGLPGNFGYIMYQDRQGYLWISTENGLARFNGYEFTVFTAKDGLPDNEIFNMAEDNQGRLWLCPFANSLCYLSQDKIYNSSNTPLLSRLHFVSWPMHLGIDDRNNFLVGEKARLTGISGNGKISRFYFAPGGEGFLTVFKEAGKLKVFFNNCIYRFDGTGFSKEQVLPASWANYQVGWVAKIISVMGSRAGVRFIEKCRRSDLPLLNNASETIRSIDATLLPDGRLAWLRLDGCFVLDTATAAVTDTFLYGHKLGPLQPMADGAVWIGTHGDGVYRFLRSPVKTADLPGSSNRVQYIRAQANGMYGILEKDKVVQVQLNGRNRPSVRIHPIGDKANPYQVYVYLGRNKKKEWISAGACFYQYRNLDRPPYTAKALGYAKDVLEEDDDHLLAATGERLVRVDRNDIGRVDTLLNSRVTTTAKAAGIIYAGTLHGIVAGTAAGNFRQITPDLATRGKHIVKMREGCGNDVWVANNSAELCIVNNQQLVALIGEDEGLQCSRISSLCLSARFMWVGTDNGLYAIRNTPPYRVVRHISQALGLGSNQVTCLDVYGTTVWAGTDRGINYFEEQEVFRPQPQPRMLINRVVSGNKDVYSSEDPIWLDQKTLSVDFDVIDHAGGQKPKFYYSINNDTGWTSLVNSDLYFPSVPYGDFTLRIRASSPNWERPLIRHLHVYRKYPFYLQWWFVAIAAIVFAGVVTAGVLLFTGRVRKKDLEKLAVQRNLLQLEQMALQGQMNPHFIFNCMAAVKQYYSTGDVRKANSFVDAFAALIRQTFEMGTETFVPLDKELSYLERYLSLEQTRFDHSFDFSIVTRLDLPATSVPVPAMLLQPLAENAVRHGVRHLSGRLGHIAVTVTQADNRIEISIADNGVGREKSRSYSATLRHAAQITSTTVNTRRIDILNRLFEQRIVHVTEDITDAHNEVAGTRVIISYPLDIYRL